MNWWRSSNQLGKNTNVLMFLSGGFNKKCWNTELDWVVVLQRRELLEGGNADARFVIKSQKKTIFHGSRKAWDFINRQINSDKLQGIIRNPFALYFPIQRGFSGPIQTLASVSAQNTMVSLIYQHSLGTSWTKLNPWWLLLHSCYHLFQGALVQWIPKNQSKNLKI